MATKEFIMPTAINMLNLVNENIVTNLRRRQDSAIEFPSLYQLAFMVHHNTGELLITRETAEE
ncbi:MAG: hypothetical protein PVI90_01095 [Desulfobacteraceae bacterium]|jgi:hypothetical protein